VFRPHPVQNIFKAAKELPGLSAETLTAIVSLESAYLTDLGAVTQQMWAAEREWEPTEQRLRAESFTKRMAGQQPEHIDNPTRELSIRRDEISRSYVRQLKALLTPEQFAQLPGAARWAEEVDATEKNRTAMPAGEKAPGQGSKNREKPSAEETPSPPAATEAPVTSPEDKPD
jgi:hypothetical protein